MKMVIVVFLKETKQILSQRQNNLGQPLKINTDLQDVIRQTIAIIATNSIISNIR